MCTTIISMICFKKSDLFSRKSSGNLRSTSGCSILTEDLLWRTLMTSKRIANLNFLDSSFFRSFTQTQTHTHIDHFVRNLLRPLFTSGRPFPILIFASLRKINYLNICKNEECCEFSPLTTNSTSTITTKLPWTNSNLQIYDYYRCFYYYLSLDCNLFL